MSYLVDGAIPLEQVLHLQAQPKTQTGAVAFFLGVIRQDQQGDKHTVSINYSAYKPMAEKIFADLSNRLLNQYGVQRVVLQHTVGQVNVGDISMLVWIESKHRKEAFAALSDAVEHIKAYSPVWKKEQYSDGSHEWVNCAHCHSAHHQQQHKHHD